jgi:hypothetical protein
MIEMVIQLVKFQLRMLSFIGDASKTPQTVYHKYSSCNLKNKYIFLCKTP